MGGKVSQSSVSTVLHAVCLPDLPHGPTIYVAHRQLPTDRAPGIGGGGSLEAAAAPLALHQIPGKISLGLRLGASRSVSEPSQRKHLRDGAGGKWWGSGTGERSLGQVGQTGSETETKESVGIAAALRRLRFPGTFQKGDS